MKKIIYILLFTQLTISLTFSQSGWFWVNPYPTGELIHNIEFTNLYTGYFCTGKSIFVTTNMGVEWIIQKADTAENFRALSFINENTGFAGGYDYYYYYPYSQYSSVYKTTNAGRYWNRIYLDTIYVITSIQFTDENHGFCWGENYNKRNFIKSTTGGAEWDVIHFDTNFIFSSFTFLNSQTGFVVGHFGNNSQGKIFKTTDGGSTWNLITLPVDIYPKSVQFVNENTGYAATNRLIKTTDGGLSWFPIYSASPNKVFFLDQNTGFVAHNNTYVLKTTDAGANWQSNFVPGAGEITSLSFSDENNGLVIGSKKNIFSTSNGGLNWSKLNSNFTDKFFYSLSSLNNDTIFAAGDNTILRSYDKGYTWDIKEIPDEGFTTVNFFNPNTGFMAGGYGPLYKTTDGGNNWFYYCSSMGNIWMFHFPSTLTGYAAGRWNNILKTTDAGASWVKIPTEFTAYHHQSVYFTDVNTGYTASEYGKVHKTINGGWNWDVVYNAPYDLFLYTVYFTNELTGFAAGGVLGNWFPIILKTTNAGVTWNESVFANGQSLHCVKFYNNKIGYAAGNYGTVYCTTNGGEDWIFQPTGTDKMLYSIICLDSLTAITVGLEGTILKTTNGGFSKEEKPPINIIPTAYKLHQNYPNPFNPSTRIKYEIPGFSNVTLKIYDILGREVAVLVNEQLSAGVYEVIWYGTNFSSGVYFYQLNITDASSPQANPLSIIYSATKKMVLLK